MSQKSAAQTFDQIRAGSQTVLLNLHGKLSDVKTYLEAGEFHEAANAIARMGQLLAPLVMAEQALGLLGQGKIIRSEEIEIGMELLNVGKIIDIEEQPCEGCAGMQLIARLENDRYVLLEPGGEFIIADTPDESP